MGFRRKPARLNDRCDLCAKIRFESFQYRGFRSGKTEADDWPSFARVFSGGIRFLTGTNYYCLRIIR